MKITVLIENMASGELCCEHGLSIYIEHYGKNYLLDTGASNTFMKNARKMQISLADVDAAFLSHAHYDHSGGYGGFFEENKKAKVYLREHAKEACYSKVGPISRYIGIPEGLLAAHPERFCFLNGDYQVEQGVWLITHKSGHLAERGKRAHMYRKVNGRFQADDFSHEQSLVFETEKGLIVLNSCSHGGIVNIVEDVKDTFDGREVYAVIGGFHLMGLGGAKTIAVSKEEVIEIGQTLLQLGVQQIYTGHCTGEPAIRILKEKFGACIHDLCTGTVIEF